MKKIILAAIVGIASLIGAKGNVGVNADLTGNTVYGASTPVSRTEKFVAGWIGDYTMSVSKTNKWYTDDPSEAWTVWTYEICKGEDDAWFVMEFGK